MRAAVRGGVDPAVARCGIDRNLTAALPMRDTRPDQLLSDAHELNSVDLLRDGTRPVEVWFDNVRTLLGSRPKTLPVKKRELR